MTFSFNEAFKNPHKISEEMKRRAEKCNGCPELIRTVDNHHWVEMCNKCSYKGSLYCETNTPCQQW